MHGPVLARNPQIADLLLKLALDVNALPPIDDRWYEALRAERIAAASSPREPSRRGHARDVRRARGTSRNHAFGTGVPWSEPV